MDVVEAWRRSRTGGCACTRCFYCDRELDVHQHDHYPVPKRAGGSSVVAACLVCHDLKDRIPIQYWDLDAMHAAFDELFLSQQLDSFRHLSPEEILDCCYPNLERNWANLSPLARVLLAKLRCTYEDGLYLDRLESAPNMPWISIDD